MREEIEQLAMEAERQIAAAATTEALEEVRRTYLGRRGRLATLFDRLPQLPQEARPATGRALNAVRARVEEAFRRRAALLAALAREARLAGERLDVTLPGWRRHLGRRHILSRTLEEVQEIFVRMGFELVDGSEVESDEFNFERLNIPPDHPARDSMDTFYIGEDLLLRTHTTVVDVRVMRERRPPMRILTAGRCYRRDVVDATHMPVFHQVDGFMVGEGITFADLKGVLITFARAMFGPEARVRFQPSYFPFTEPSAEVAVWFNGGWLELGGCGMFHPRVLEMAGIDPERYTAFAFGGFGDRVVMARYGIPDIRMFWENDLRLLRQF
ncbi:MAG: phenylalanine--tRNA ligase subunit alpha [Armatimonadota bacterium]|nr:phenylalanine--tRNA ligase subunit alpha [Armatimonadota bacterium]MDR7427474.1 phenylalanine--tRNA ligase subunit alpha [Armatimonadota bacterium]MDR7463820.1 phenylalanine--tRNA ligase subunit alpha [Armatimonadota bacterium]MDR7469966.1 phenylalanine--tRNA ligase subunit alpha [Armatimonadota bacterium]MDR7474473.1 phenylalanine--tRNA ligase subunit alpha [Armatimonadota bacterium]